MKSSPITVAAVLSGALALGACGSNAPETVTACASTIAPFIVQQNALCDSGARSAGYFTTYADRLESDDVPTVGQPLDDDFLYDEDDDEAYGYVHSKPKPRYGYLAPRTQTRYVAPRTYAGQRPAKPALTTSSSKSSWFTKGSPTPSAGSSSRSSSSSSSSSSKSGK